MTIQVKICGVKTDAAIAAAVEHGAAFLGFNFYPPSPRYVTPEQAGELAKRVPASVKKVALLVDVDDATLAAILKHFPADILQLHGSETPARAEEIKARYGLPIIKAFPVAEDADLEEASMFEASVDYFLFDAKPPAGAELPGGNAASFNWALMKHARVMKPWLLAGGLNVKNVRTAVADSGATMVDVSSGVERVRGEKDAAMIAAFLQEALAI